MIYKLCLKFGFWVSLLITVMVTSVVLVILWWVYFMWVRWWDYMNFKALVKAYRENKTKLQ